MSLHRSPGEVRYVKVEYTVKQDGVAIDPSGLAVSMAFVAAGAEPEAADWEDAEWESVGPPSVARCLVGPGAVVLAIGRYVIWLRIVVGLETIVDPVDLLVIELGALDFTYDLNTDVGQVRLLIPDTDQTVAVYTDAELAGLLAIAGDPLRAAALALDGMASSSLGGTKVKIEGYEFSTGTSSATWSARAKSLREQAEYIEAQDGDLFDFAQTALDWHDRARLQRNAVIRGEWP